MVQAKNERRSKKTSERHSSLREELIGRAEAVIAAQGLSALRARELAAEAGCSVGAIYNVFSDLDGLILEVSALTLRAIDREMTAVTGETPLATLLGLADAYLDYALANRRRWDALFSHRMPVNTPDLPWFNEVKDAAFSHIEGPLHLLCPRLSAEDCRRLGRSIFAAVHGMVALGLDQRVATLDLAALRGQIRTVVQALANGLQEESSFL